METLSNAALGSLPAGVARPLYERAALPLRVVHFGAGAFFRSHLAIYLDRLAGLGNEPWGVLAVSLRSPGINRSLVPQDNLYTVVEQSTTPEHVQVVGSVVSSVSLPDDPQQVCDALVQPQVALVSMTLTDQGYCYDTEGECLNRALPEIDLDIKSPAQPRSALGVLALAIARRKQLDLKPFTLLSCDRMPANGKVLQRVLEHYIEQVQETLGDPDLLAYFLDQYACPCTLVDRRARAATDDEALQVQHILGVRDDAAVMAEPYSLFVVQDWFCNDRPEWKEAGVIVTTHVAPYEKLQYRLHDAGFLMAACLGRMQGCQTLHEAMAVPSIRLSVAALMADAAVTLDKHPEFDWEAYRDIWLERFANPWLNVSLADLLQDASQRLSWVVSPAVADRLKHGLPVLQHARLVAAWLHHVMQGAVPGGPVLHDRRAALLRECVLDAGGAGAGAAQVVDNVLSQASLFGPAGQDKAFRLEVASALQAMLQAA